MTKIDIEQEIVDWYNTNDIGVTASELDSDVWDEFYESVAWSSAKPILASGKVNLEEDFGGEGQGDQRYVVWSIGEGDAKQYFKVSGYYASWDGTTWDDLTPYEVEPFERTVIEFRRKKA